MILTGDYLPHFALYNQNQRLRRNDDYEGKWLVLFIYPKDDTPGCTLESKDFQQSLRDFDKLETKVVGLSADNTSSHANFCHKYLLTFDFLADPEEKLLKQIDAGFKENNGEKFWNRTTFIMNERGIVKHIFENVVPENHVNHVLKFVQKMKEDYQ